MTNSQEAHEYLCGKQAKHLSIGNVVITNSILEGLEYYSNPEETEFALKTLNHLVRHLSLSYADEILEIDKDTFCNFVSVIDDAVNILTLLFKQKGGEL